MPLITFRSTRNDDFKKFNVSLINDGVFYFGGLGFTPAYERSLENPEIPFLCYHRDHFKEENKLKDTSIDDDQQMEFTRLFNPFHLFLDGEVVGTAVSIDSKNAYFSGILLNSESGKRIRNKKEAVYYKAEYPLIYDEHEVYNSDNLKRIPIPDSLSFNRPITMEITDTLIFGGATENLVKMGIFINDYDLKNPENVLFTRLFRGLIDIIKEKCKNNFTINLSSDVVSKEDEMLTSIFNYCKHYLEMILFKKVRECEIFDNYKYSCFSQNMGSLSFTSLPEMLKKNKERELISEIVESGNFELLEK